MIDKIYRGTFPLRAGYSDHRHPVGRKAVKGRRNGRHGKTGIFHLQINRILGRDANIRRVDNDRRAIGNSAGYVLVSVGVQARQGKEESARFHLSGIVFQTGNQRVSGALPAAVFLSTPCLAGPLALVDFL